MADENELEEAIDQVDRVFEQVADAVDAGEIVVPDDIQEPTRALVEPGGSQMLGANAKKVAEVAKSGSRKEKQRMALQMRIAGLTYAQIAANLDIGQATAHGYVKDALEQYNLDDAKTLRDVQYARLEFLAMQRWPDVIRPGGDENGTKLAQYLAITDRITSMMGLNVSDRFIGEGGTEGEDQGVLVVGGDKDNYMSAMRNARKRVKGNG